MKPRLKVYFAAAAAAVVAPIENLHAYPEQPIRVVVPFGPGGFADITIRIMR